MVKRRQSTRRSKTRGSVDAKTIVLTIAALVGVVFLFVIKQVVYTEAKTIDSNYCKKGTPPEIIAVLIDHTDPISPVQRTSIKRHLEDETLSISKNGIIYLYEVDETVEDALSPDLKLCNPGSSKDVNELTGNPELAQKKFKQKFANAINDSLNSLLNSNIANRSPIMESVKSVVVTSYQGDRLKDSPKKLILVSDLIQHTDSFSQYSNNIDFDTFKTTAFGQTISSDLEGVEVELLFLVREKTANFQTPDLKKFWQRYFLDQGATRVIFTPI